MKSEKISKIRKRFHNEWLLIKVDKFDRKTTTPLTGHLIAHSPTRDKIYQKSMSHKGLDLITFSEDKLPKGYAIAF